MIRSALPPTQRTFEMPDTSNYYSKSTQNYEERKRRNDDNADSDVITRAKIQKSKSPPEYSDHDDYLRDEKLNRRRRGNTESQARNRQHQKIVSEKYAQNDKLIAQAKERLIQNRTDAEQILRDILTQYETMPQKTRATRYDTRTTTGLVNLCVG